MIDEQRFDPFSRSDAKRDELLKNSLIYERARTRIEEAAQKVARERKDHLSEIARTGEPFDESFDLALAELRGLTNRMGAKADELWTQMEKAGEKFGPGLERLANAVLEKAAYDYEAALCGGFPDSEGEMRLIEKFAVCGAEVYTTLDFSEVLGQIRRVYRDEWRPTAERIAPELRKEVRPRYHTKCPLCGGGLYYVHSKGQSDLVRCTTCGLFYLVKKKKGTGTREECPRRSAPPPFRQGGHEEEDAGITPIGPAGHFHRRGKQEGADSHGPQGGPRNDRKEAARDRRDRTEAERDGD